MLTNITKAFTISNSFKLCRTQWQQARGLMFSFPKTLVFEFHRPRKIGLHMFFVFFPIDVAFLNASREVVDIKRRFMPFTIYTSAEKASYVIETPTGGLNRTEKGDILHWA